MRRAPPKVNRTVPLVPSTTLFRSRPVELGGTLGREKASVRESVAILQANYCGHVGLEYMHSADVEERRFLQDRMEGADKRVEFTPEGKQAILKKVIDAEE